MPESMGLTEFFAMEAADYLDRLDALVSKGPPEAADLMRLARALRGSALMANQQSLAAAAAGFEQVARGMREGKVTWDPAAQQAVVRAVDDFRVLVRRLAEWTPADDERARGIGSGLQMLTGAAPAPTHAAGASSDARARALIAQQGAALASVLERAAQTGQADPKGQQELNAVLQLIQPLRGVASLADFPPLPDILDAIERCVGEVRRAPRPAGELSAALRSAGLAIARAAREVAAGSRAEAESPELAGLVDHLAKVLDLDPTVVPIEALFVDDAGPHVLEPGVAPLTSSPLGGAELVTHGEYLTQMADGIQRGRTAPERELRALGLLGTFRTLAGGGDGPLAKAAATFGRAGREALAQRWASKHTAGFVRLLRQAGDALSAAGRLEEPRLATLLTSLTAALRQTVTTGLAAPAESAAPATTAPAVPAPEEEAPGLAGSYQRFQRLATALGLGAPSVEALLSGPPSLPVAAPPARPRAATPVPSAPPPRVSAGGDGLVPITDLVYQGSAALDRALALRDDVRRALVGSPPDADAVRELIEEILDLVALGQGRG